ncbi:hypothetical protein Bpfe_020402 [Biomphalaria pfeifferi]|uniref:Uncharacterized protein n=1 Tax=Biomphalaria pfeifferi TaxID=112525 RepID=A0AAD8BA82_BIOPF|nr:hypothetical protein Bpfe_020402 [Biomphalaria pfeifferi]
MGNKVDKIVSQAKEGTDALVKEQLPADSLVKENLPGEDCGCTNSDDGDAGDWSAAVLWASLEDLNFKTRKVTTITATISTGCTKSKGKRQI